MRANLYRGVIDWDGDGRRVLLASGKMTAYKKQELQVVVVNVMLRFCLICFANLTDTLSLLHWGKGSDWP
jgi:hypothetical protein